MPHSAPGVGDQVRKPSVSEPHYEWGRLDRANAAAVHGVDGGDCRVRFPEDSDWIGRLAEIERVETTGMQVGSRVRRYKVRCSNGETKWYRPEQVQLASASGSQGRPTTGDTVVIQEGEMQERCAVQVAGVDAGVSSRAPGGEEDKDEDNDEVEEDDQDGEDSEVYYSSSSYEEKSGEEGEEGEEEVEELKDDSWVEQPTLKCTVPLLRTPTRYHSSYRCLCVHR
eukprot:Transcript_24006.p3 GENE.Transcript_24006~~Transcript_24006.p3  ORF type:complete len:250 (-),score=24.69 Transcript_24006:2018-2692(-)